MKYYLHKSLLIITLICLTNLVCGFSVYANSLEDACRAKLHLEEFINW